MYLPSLALTGATPKTERRMRALRVELRDRKLCNAETGEPLVALTRAGGGAEPYGFDGHEMDVFCAELAARWNAHAVEG